MAIGAEPTTGSARQVVLLFSDIVDSVGMKTRLGDQAYVLLLKRHAELFRDAMSNSLRGVLLKDTGDGFLAQFETPGEAVCTALSFQWALANEPWQSEAIRVRIAIHAGTAIEVPDERGRYDVSGLAVDLAARVMSLAGPSQILLTNHCFNDARQYVREHPRIGSGEAPPLAWLAHGPYVFQGADEPILIHEVGARGVAPLEPPRNTDKARQAVPAGDEETYGWRPARGLEVPHRPGWFIERQLGVGGSGEVWLAQHQRTRGYRVFKFCFDPDRLRSLKRELTLFRLLRDVLGDRSDIARLYEVNFESPPFYLESEYAPLGDLRIWAQEQGGIQAVPMDFRLELLRQVAQAVAAAHSVGVLHKDLKPSNVLIDRSADGTPRPMISDFGIGVLQDRARLLERHITMSGFTVTQTTANLSSRSGTPMYAPPEMLAPVPSGHADAKPAAFTAQGDVYAIGVMLYQMLAGDLDRPLAPGWQRDLERTIEDPVRREILTNDVAEMVDGDVGHRLASAAEAARRLGALDQRCHELAQARQEQLAREEVDRRMAALRRRVGAAVRWTIAASLMALLGVSWFFLNRERGLRAQEIESRTLAESRARDLEEVKRFLGTVLTGADLEAMSMDMVGEIRQALQMSGALGRNPDSLPDQPIAGPGPGTGADDRPPLRQDGPPIGRGGPNDARRRPAVAALDELTRQGAPTVLAIHIVNKHFFSRAIVSLRDADSVRPVVKASLFQTLADLMMDVGFLEGAEQALSRAREIREELLSPHDADSIETRISLGVLLREQGRIADAVEQLEAALETCRTALGPDDPLTIQASHRLALTLILGGEPRQAIELIGDRSAAGGDVLALSGEIIHARALGASGRVDEARAMLEATFAKASSALGSDSALAIEAELRFAELLARAAQVADAKPHFENAIALRRRTLGRSHRQTLEAELGRASVLLAVGELDSIEPTPAALYEDCHKTLGPAHRVTTEAAEVLALFLIQSDELEEAESLLNRMLDTAGPEFEYRAWRIAAPATILADRYEALHAQFPSEDYGERAAIWRARSTTLPPAGADQ
ncbi:MAG: tetratricopeptide repeat protein [Phycisphaerales bacterium]|nr:tetratricopeptide repeat protein [Phycisphaerales bacterium]